MEVAKCCEVILAHQDVRVSQVRQVLHLGLQLVLNVLSFNKQSMLFYVRHKTRNSYIKMKGGGSVLGSYHVLIYIVHIKMTHLSSSSVS